MSDYFTASHRDELKKENRELKERIKRMEEMYEGVIGEKPELLGSNVMGLLKRELNFAQNRIKRLEEALDTLTLVVGLTPIVGNKDALQEAMDMARAELKAKEAKP